MQFHALPHELEQLIASAVHDFKLQIVGFQFAPFQAVELSAADLSGILHQQASFREIALVRGHPDVGVRSRLEFADKNPSYLRITLEYPIAAGLRQ